MSSRKYRVKHTRLAETTGPRRAGSVDSQTLGEWLVEAMDVRTALDAVRRHVRPLAGEVLAASRNGVAGC